MEIPIINKTIIEILNALAVIPSELCSLAFWFDILGNNTVQTAFVSLFRYSAFPFPIEKKAKDIGDNNIAVNKFVK